MINPKVRIHASQRLCHAYFGVHDCPRISSTRYDKLRQEFESRVGNTLGKEHGEHIMRIFDWSVEALGNRENIHG